MADSRLPWVYLATSGDVAYELERLADKLSADAIIVGRSRRRIRTLRASVSKRLIASARRIVVVVP
jgi:nucleotide-binding universal stress UspA family protein